MKKKIITPSPFSEEYVFKILNQDTNNSFSTQFKIIFISNKIIRETSFCSLGLICIGWIKMYVNMDWNNYLSNTI